jgi:peptide/nickel transport system permease protein
LLLLIPTAWAIVTITFFALKLAPGSAVNFLLQINRTPAAVAALNHQFGLDKPIMAQYVDWLGGLVHGNLGQSWATSQSISGQLTALAPPTFELILAGLLLSIVIAVPAALFAATHQRRLGDNAIRTLATAGVSLPTFWLGLLFVLLFAVKLRWLPSSGYVAFTDDPVGNLEHLALPAITLAAPLAGILIRMLRSSIVEALHADHIRTAEAKGVPRRLVIRRHAFRCALIPSVTVVGLQVGYLLVGTIILSQVFDWPGFGQYLLQGISSRDTPVVQAMVLIYALFFAVVNIGVDIIYGFVDPRVRHGEST